MGLGLRIASAKRLALAFAGMLLLATTPAVAVPACTLGLPTSITSASPPTFVVSGDEAFSIDDNRSEPITFTGVGAASIDVSADFTASPTSAIIFDGSFSSVCFNGYSGAVTLTSEGPLNSTYFGAWISHEGLGAIVIDTGAIEADFAGIVAQQGVDTTGDISITARGRIAGSTAASVESGIVAYHYGTEGSIIIATLADIVASEVGLDVQHTGETGNVLITTATGTTLSATGGTSVVIPSFMPGSVGILAVRSSLDPNATGGITISNGANIVSDLAGIYADVSVGCGCSVGSVSITTSGDITAHGVTVPGFDLGAGIIATAGEDAQVDIGAGTVTGPMGALISADHVLFNVGAPAIVKSVGTDPSGSGPSLTPFDFGYNPYGVSILLDTDYGADVTVGGRVEATTGDAAILIAGYANSLTLLPGFDIVGNVYADPFGSSNVLVLGGSGTDAFDLGFVADLSVTSATSGYQYFSFDTLQKTGTSSWTLMDSGIGGTPFVGIFSANDGKLIINSDILGLDLELTGTGSVGGRGTFNSLTANGGILAPGNSIGTLTIVGDAAFTNLAYAVEVNAAGQSDLFDVGGTVDLTGGGNSVIAQPEAGGYARTTTYTILTANDPAGITGTFDSVSSASPYFTAALSGDTNNVLLTLTRKDLTSVVAGLTPNQQSTGTGLDSFASAPPYFEHLMVLPTAQLPAALSALSGDGYASLISALITDQRYLRDAALDRLTTARFTPEPIIATGYAADPDTAPDIAPDIWGRAYGGLSALAGDGNGPGVAHASGGVVAGADTSLGSGRAGIFAAAGFGAFAIPDRAMTASTGAFSVGAYGDAEWDRFYLSFGATFTGHSIATTRTAAFAGANDTYTANYGALTSHAFGELGYRVDLGATTLTPFAGLALVNNLASGYTEAGTGPGALTIAPSSISAAITTIGARVEHQFTAGGTTLVTLSASAAWRHILGGAGATTNAFAGGAPFAVAGAPAAADQLLLTAGANFDISESLTFGLDYSGALGNGGSHALTATLAGRF